MGERREGGRERQRERQMKRGSGEGRREEPVTLRGEPESWSWARFAIHFNVTLSESLFSLIPPSSPLKGSWWAPHPIHTEVVTMSQRVLKNVPPCPHSGIQKFYEMSITLSPSSR